jgi:dTDP-4-amino-4,6-dideoxygalactose transaminase
MRFKKIVRQELYLAWPAVLAALKTVLRSEVVEGHAIEAFEDRFARYVGVRHALTVPSGRMALYVSLKALKLNPGSEIIIPSYNVPEVVSAVIWAGMQPKFVDIDPATYNISPELLEAHLTEKTGAILLTHLYGQPAHIERIVRLAEKHKILVVEDAAQALGASYQGRKVGAFGEIAYFSFGLVKNLNCLGGGMAVTDHTDLYDAMKCIVRDFSPPSPFKLIKDLLAAIGIRIATAPFAFSAVVYPALALVKKFKRGIIEESFNEDLGELSLSAPPAYYRVRFANLQAAMGVEQLKSLDRNNQKRRKNAELLSSLLKDAGAVTIPSVIPGVESTYLNYVVTLKNPDGVIDRLFQKGVDATRGFLIDCSSHPLFKDYHSESPHAGHLARQGLYLPIYPSLTEKDIHYIADTLKRVA